MSFGTCAAVGGDPEMPHGRKPLTRPMSVVCTAGLRVPCQNHSAGDLENLRRQRVGYAISAFGALSSAKGRLGRVLKNSIRAPGERSQLGPEDAGPPKT